MSVKHTQLIHPKEIKQLGVRVTGGHDEKNLIFLYKKKGTPYLILDCHKINNQERFA
jgi:hypothetical protein